MTRSRLLTTYDHICKTYTNLRTCWPGLHVKTGKKITNQPEAINQLTNKAILEVGMIERNRLEYLLHAHWSWKSRVKLKAGLSLGIDGILAQRRNWPWMIYIRLKQKDINIPFSQAWWEQQPNSCRRVTSSPTDRASCVQFSDVSQSSAVVDTAEMSMKTKQTCMAVMAVWKLTLFNLCSGKNITIRKLS